MINGAKQYEDADIVISSMPLQELVYSIEKCPENVRSVARKLKYRDMIIVALEINKNYIGEVLQAVRLDSWVYVQNENTKFGRIQILNNWSPLLVKDSSSILVELEFFCNKDDITWKLADEQILDVAITELIENSFVSENIVVKKSFVKRIPKAYPVYIGEYYNLDIVRNWIDTIENLYCIGRNGQHHYNNMDHSMETSLAAVDIILNKKKSMNEIWNVNMDKK